MDELELREEFKAALLNSEAKRLASEQVTFKLLYVLAARGLIDCNDLQLLFASTVRDGSSEPYKELKESSPILHLAAVSGLEAQTKFLQTEVLPALLDSISKQRRSDLDGSSHLH